MFNLSCRAGHALIASVAAIGLASPAWADPAHVIVSLPDGAALPADLAPTLSKWRQAGDVADVLWLSANQQQNAGFNTLVELDFPSEADYQKWAAKDAAALRAPLEVHKVDALVHGE